MVIIVDVKVFDSDKGHIKVVLMNVVYGKSGGGKGGIW